MYAFFKRTIYLLLNVSLLSLSSAFAGDLYLVQELSGVQLGSLSARAINLAGQVVGGSGTVHGLSTVPLMWSPDLSVLSLTSSLPQTDYAEAFGISDRQQIVGAFNTAQSLRAFSWNLVGMRFLSPLVGDKSSQAFAVNSSGVVAGVSAGSKGIRAVLWSGSTPRRLPSLSGNRSSEAVALNSLGDAAGYSIAPNGKARAVLWFGSEVKNLGVLPGDTSSRATALNDARHVVGYSEGSNGPRAFFWSESTGQVRLGTLPGGMDSEAFGINNQDYVVGSSSSSLGRRAFVWTSADGMQDLNTLIPKTSGIILAEAVAINQNGQIVAVGNVNHDLLGDRPYDMDDQDHAGPAHVFLLTPVRR